MACLNVHIRISNYYRVFTVLEKYETLVPWEILQGDKLNAYATPLVSVVYLVVNAHWMCALPV